MPDSSPPPFGVGRTVELDASIDGKITAVTLYPSRAEIRRRFIFSVNTGHNLVLISSLPSVLDQDSLRVEGKGSATIHDVALAHASPPTPPNDSQKLRDLLSAHERTIKAIARCQNSIAALKTYLASLTLERVPVADVPAILSGYDAAGRQLDDQLLDLERELTNINQQLDAERANLRTSVSFNDRLTRRASIGVFADNEGDVEIDLIYFVHSATWAAVYDIRVDMQNTKEPVQLIYKASISQNTAEDWTDVPLTLETAIPTIGVAVPTLDPWTLSVHRAPPPMVLRSMAPASPAGGPVRHMIKRRVASVTSRDAEEIHEESLGGFVAHRTATVTSRGTVSATFQVPGLTSIPCDATPHNVTIASLRLGATLSWVVVPKKDTKPRLLAQIKNASEYTFLRGSASIYVDGSFIACTDVPPVSPDESFDCPLGLDTSIRVIYHPLSRKYIQSGFMQKTAHHVFTQTITIHNTKSTQAAHRVRVLDQFPVSEDAEISVKQVSPALPPPPSTLSNSTANSATITSAVEAAKKAVTVQSGVQAMWEGADEPEVDGEALGRNGKFVWSCNVPPQGKVNLTLQWEVTAPPKTDVVGLFA